MKRSRKILLGLVTLLIVIQFIPIPKTNPPITGEIALPPQVHAVMKRACYDCHSNETVWPWYSHVAPVSWLLYRDVTQGRRAMNFSAWQQMTPTRQAKKRSDVWEQVGGGDMPPWFYIPLHPPSKLSDADKAVLKAWSEGKN